MTQRVDSMEKEMQSNNENMANFHDTELSKRLQQTDSDLESLNTNQQTLGSAITTIEATLDNLTKSVSKCVDKDKKVKAQIAEIESTVTQLQ